LDASLRKHGITRGAVAQVLEVSRQLVDAWASGRRPVPARREAALILAVSGLIAVERAAGAERLSALLHSRRVGAATLAARLGVRSVERWLDPAVGPPRAQWKAIAAALAL
jgi:DNA-binding transcriptional regulator YdaS (Cro superfamily)